MRRRRADAMMAARGTKLGIGAEQAGRAGGGHRALADHGHSRGAGVARAPPAPGQPRLPRRLGAGPGRAHHRVRRWFGAAQRLARDPAEMGVLGAAGLRDRAPRVGRLPLVHPAPAAQHAALDALVRHAVAGAGRGGGSGAGAAAARGAHPVCGSRFGRRQQQPERGRPAGRRRDLRRAGRVDGGRPDPGLRRCRGPLRRCAGAPQSVDGSQPRRDAGGHPAAGSG